MQVVILMGAPGVGKGTVAERITEDGAWTHLSTGDMLREAVKAGSPVGLEAKAYMDAGELVPDEVIMKIVIERMEQDAGAAKYVFDGFPRTIEQARLLDEVLQAHATDVKYVFLLEAPKDLLVERLAGRRVCRNCGAVYHVRYVPPREPGVCDVCGGALYQREDDCEATVLNRLDVFRKQTESLIDYYERKKLLVRVDAAQSKEHTEAQILRRLEDAAP